MIQVIGRVASIIEKLAATEELTLSQLSDNGALNHGTLCNILRSLIEVGWLEKNNRGRYRLRTEFREMGNPAPWPPEMLAYLNRETQELSAKIQESVVISTLAYNKVVILSQAKYQHTLMVNDERLYARLSLYTSVSGEILCAGLTAEQRRALYRFQPPTAQDLRDDVDIAGYEKKLSRLREEGVNISTSERYGIKSWALPVSDQEGAICACLGLSVPLVRLPADGGEAILLALRSSQEKITRWIAKNNYRARNFLRLPISFSNATAKYPSQKASL